LQSADPAILAARTGASYHPADENRGDFRLKWWSKPVRIAFPSFDARDGETDESLDVMSQAMLLYYFHDSDGTTQANSWIAFSELPDGYFYAQAFQGYTGQVLLRTFGDDASAFETALRNAGGDRLTFAGVSYAFQVLPKLALLAACWPGDEDFPSSYRILFDASSSHHLSTDGCAILGSMLTRRIIGARQY
jgi:hypothetical protein